MNRDLFETLVEKDYKIFVDTSSLMQKDSEIVFFQIIAPLLHKYKRQIIIPKSVLNEISIHNYNNHKDIKKANHILNELLKFKKDKYIILGVIANISKIKGIEIAGKTGTAENFIKINGKRSQLTDHSIFIGFAPKENPKIAIAVFIENGYWGTRWAAPIASLMMEKYLKKEVKRKYLENYILNGNLMEEYLKPYTKNNFSINE